RRETASPSGSGGGATAAAHCSAAGPTAGTRARRTTPTAARSAATAATTRSATAAHLGVGQRGKHGRKRYRRRDHHRVRFMDIPRTSVFLETATRRRRQCFRIATCLGP